MITIFSSPADEGGPQAFAKELLLNRNCLLESLTCVNKATSGCYIQLFNSPRKLAVPITDTDSVTGIITAAAHGFVTGDYVTLTGIAGVTSGYLRVINANSFNLHSTRALALADGDPDVLPDNDDDTGSLDLASNLTSAPVAEEYPLGAETAQPTNVLSLTNAKFGRGLYVRAVTAINGSTLISAADIKFTPRYRTLPLTNPLSYED